MDLLATVWDTLVTSFYMAIIIVRDWPAFRGLFIFALLLTAVHLWSRIKVGESYGLSDFMPSSGAIWSVSNNIGIMLFNAFVWSAMFAGLFVMADDLWTVILGEDRFAPLTGWPMWVQLIAVLFIVDFANYWSHRLLHRPWAWEVHALHHSDRHMNCLTSYRIHFLEAIQMAIVVTLIMGWLDLPALVGGIAGVIRLWSGFYVHSGLPFDHGRFRKVLASPNYHRWHHADDPAIYGKNLAEMFPVIDMMFGTYHDPGWCDLPTGVSDAPDDVVRGQIHPFRRYIERFRSWRQTRLEPSVRATSGSTVSQDVVVD